VRYQARFRNCNDVTVADAGQRNGGCRATARCAYPPLQKRPQKLAMPFDVRSDIDRLPWRCAFHEPLALYLASIPGVSHAPNWHRRSGSEGAIYSRAPWRAGSGTNIAKVAGPAMLKPSRQGDARSEKNTGAIKVEQAHTIGRSAGRHSLKRVRTLVDI